MRIPSLVKQLLEEVRATPLDEAGRTRLAEAHRRSIGELEQGLAPDLVEELERITSAIRRRAPNDAELRIAQAQLLGWLEGLLHGVQPSCFSHEMATQQQLQTMRRPLPPGQPGQDGRAGRTPSPGTWSRPDPGDGGSTGAYHNLMSVSTVFSRAYM